MSKTALIILARGAEEMELVITTDVLRRAGIKVTIAGLCDSNPVQCSRDVVICPDTPLEAAKDSRYDAVILPGGLEGSKNLASSKVVGEILKKQESEGRLLAAICAAPTVFAAHGIGLGKRVTSYPSMQSELESKYKYVQDLVVEDSNIITSRGPYTAFKFALKIAEVLVGVEKVAEVARGILYTPHKK